MPLPEPALARSSRLGCPAWVAVTSKSWSPREPKPLWMAQCQSPAGSRRRTFPLPSAATESELPGLPVRSTQLPLLTLLPGYSKPSQKRPPWQMEQSGVGEAEAEGVEEGLGEALKLGVSLKLGVRVRVAVGAGQ